MYHMQMSGRYTFPTDVAIALNYRMQSGFPYARIVDGSVSASPTLNVVQLRVHVLRREPRSESIGNW